MNKTKNSLSMQFKIFWTGQLLSKTGRGISTFVLGIHVLEKKGSTASFSMMLLASFLPSALLNPAGGVIADRKNRKSLIIIGDLGAAAGVLAIFDGLRFFPDNIYLLLSGISLISVFSALHSRAYKATVTDMLDKDQYVKAAGLIQLSEASRFLLSPAIAAFLISRINLTSILWIDFISFITAAAAVLHQV